MKSLILVLAFCATFVSAFENTENAQKEARLFYSNNGNMFVGLNATTLWAVAGVALVGFALVALYFSVANGQKSAAYNRYGSEYESGYYNDQAYYQNDFSQTRQRRFASGKKNFF